MGPQPQPTDDERMTRPLLTASGDPETCRPAPATETGNAAARRGFALAAQVNGAASLVLTIVLLLRDRLELIVAGVEIPALVSAELAGRISRFPGYRSWSAPEFEVDSGRPLIEAGLDGEAMRLAPPLRFRILPGALRVRVPHDAPGTSPAALPGGTRATVADLVRVLAGRAS